MMKKLFKAPKITHWNIIEKETIDEVIFCTMQPRNHLMLELMAKGRYANRRGAQIDNERYP
jgi:hypothetical protein